MTLTEAKAIVEALVTLRTSATDEQALQVPVLYPVWKSGVTYKSGDRVLYKDTLYKVLTEHISQDDWAPDAAVSLFAKVLIPNPDTIPEWEQPDSTNPYMKDDKVSHNESTWVSLVDNNVWEPTEAVSILWQKL